VNLTALAISCTKVLGEFDSFSY